MKAKLITSAIIVWAAVIMFSTLNSTAKDYRYSSTFNNFSGFWATGATQYSTPVDTYDAKKKTVVVRGMTSSGGAYLTTTTGAYTIECSNSMTSNTFVTCYDQNGTAATGVIDRPWHFDDAVRYVRIKWVRATNWLKVWMLYDNSVEK